MNSYKSIISFDRFDGFDRVQLHFFDGNKKSEENADADSNNLHRTELWIENVDVGEEIIPHP